MTTLPESKKLQIITQINKIIHAYRKYKKRINPVSKKKNNIILFK
jgi:hypothetical protein